jgi:hypothetical protein
MEKELVTSVMRLLTHNDAEMGDVVPETKKLNALEEVLAYISSQDNYAHVMEAIDDVRDIISVVVIVRAEAY